jgi:hypothetical protein
MEATAAVAEHGIANVYERVRMSSSMLIIFSVFVFSSFLLGKVKLFSIFSLHFESLFAEILKSCFHL